jgi:acyl carrier protein
MHRLLKTTLSVTLVALLLTPSTSAQDRATMVQQLRAELARILKKDAAQLPVDKPVTGLGADDLDVVEWQMAAEKAFRVNISDDKLFDPKSKAVRKDLSISSMAEIVAKSPPWPKRKTK